jgi:hypothetical protein
MHLLNKVTLALATAGLLSSGVAQAKLIDRGGGLLYDDVLNVTWLQDANYAQTSGYDTDGKMNWTDAKTWADNLVFHDSVRNVDYSDWRLPATSDTDAGWNIISPNSELSYMYYVNLGLTSKFSPSGAEQPHYGIFRNGTEGGQADVGLAKNLQSYYYWFGTVYAPSTSFGTWYFVTSVGAQFFNYQNLECYAWAVRPGDVAAAVPEPETYAMLLAGLGLLGVGAKRRRSFGAS